MQQLSSFNSPSSPSASSNRSVADSVSQEEEGPTQNRQQHHSFATTSAQADVPTFATSTIATSSTTNTEVDTSASLFAAANNAVGRAYDRVAASGRTAHDYRRTSEVPAWRQDLSIPNLASIVPLSDLANSFSAASTTGAIHQSSLSTAGSPRGPSASTRGLPSSPIPSKRPSAPARGEPVMHPSPIKKARTGASPPRKVELPNKTTGLDPSARGKQQGPLSPLFFSHTPARHVHRPASFPATEPSVSMLSRMREDPAGGVTTLKLPVQVSIL
ncbi:hypothetical protein NXS19_001048 [Fusarium pseudograminearum]|nr:hypothetical protein NXS19_001048 [Fusarium pseudograminearum]